MAFTLLLLVLICLCSAPVACNNSHSEPHLRNGDWRSMAQEIASLHVNRCLSRFHLTSMLEAPTYEQLPDNFFFHEDSRKEDKEAYYNAWLRREKSIRGKVSWFKRWNASWRREKPLSQSNSSTSWPQPFAPSLFWTMTIDRLNAIDLLRECHCNENLKFTQNATAETRNHLYFYDDGKNNTFMLKKFEKGLFLPWNGAVYTPTSMQPSSVNEALTEYWIGSRLNHPNLRKSYSCFYNKMDVILKLEYLDGWTLHQIWLHADSKPNFRLSERWFQMVTFIIHGILKGLEALHSHGIIHRDIKLENIIVTKQGRVVILDFEAATSTLGRRVHGTISGTEPYHAPELIRGSAHLASDLYSLGVIVIELLYMKDINFVAWNADQSSHFLFQQQSLKNVMEENFETIRTLFKTTTWTQPDVKSFLDGCIVEDPKHRWRVFDALNHPFVTRASSLTENTMQLYLEQLMADFK